MYQFFCVSRKPNQSFHFKAANLDAAIDECEQHGIPRTEWERESTPDPHAPIATAPNWKLWQTEIKKSYWNTLTRYDPEKERREREERERKEHQALLDRLRKLYSDVSLRHSVIQLLWRKPRLSYEDMAYIKEVDEADIQFEIERAYQDAT